MNNLAYKLRSIGKYCIPLSLILYGFTPVQSEQAISAGIDCTNIEINYQDNPELSKAEKLILMEQAFYDSLNKFELCNLSTNVSTSSASSGAAEGSSSGSAASAGEDASEATNTAKQQASIADDTLQGTEPEVKLPNTTSPPLVDSTATKPAGGNSNGKTPEDIPPAANDDAIAAQIRLAAELETDPETRKKLWDEYRKYKEISIEQ